MEAMTKEYLAHGQSMVDWSGDLTLADPHYHAVLKEITVLLHARYPDLHRIMELPPDVRRQLNQTWQDIQDAVGTYEAALWLANLPAEPRLDWRSGLRDLKKQPDLLEGYLEHDVYRIVLACGLGLDNDTLDENMEDDLEIPLEGLGEAIDAILANEILIERGGPERDWALDQFIASIADVYKRLTERQIGFSRFALDKIKNGRLGGPAIRFLRACVNLVRKDVTDEALAYRIVNLRQKHHQDQ